MRSIFKLFFSMVLTISMIFSFIQPSVFAMDEEVQKVITQLENIDTLQEMQDKRYTYSVTTVTDSTNKKALATHEKKRSEYETYVSNMFAARLAAQTAYDALTDEQKAQIDISLVNKLNNTLPNVFHKQTFSITPSKNEYAFQSVYGYEVGTSMVSKQIPQTFILVDTIDGKTSWTPNGLFEYGNSNYDVTYCCDVTTPIVYGTNYKRVNLEDSNYYGKNASKHIRAILENSYPYVSVDQMKANLKAGGLNANFVDSLSRGDLISAVQMAIWSYANSNDFNGATGYYATIDVKTNIGRNFNPIHDYTNETWNWTAGYGLRTYDAEDEYRINNLAYYLCNLEGVEANDDQIVISNIKVSRADLVARSTDLYNVGMYVYLNNGGRENDDLVVNVISYHVNEDGTTTITSRNNQPVNGREKISISVNARKNDMIKVTVEGTQTVSKGVYFYEPEGGRDVSQSLVGVSQGKTRIKVEETFEFVENIDQMGLRIYKTDGNTGYPLSDITFDIYKVNETVEDLSKKPTSEEIEKIKVEENKVASLTTDTTGYAHTTLEKGIYLIVEQHNSEKVKAPADPFYLTIPMQQQIVDDEGNTSIEVLDIVSIYPKNDSTEEPEEPPVVPPTPDKVTGQFSILKVDSKDKQVLERAKFQLYKPALPTDTNTETIEYNGIKYAVVPVFVDGNEVILITDENGTAISPKLECGAYFLVETKAPSGYNLLEEAISITILSSEVSDIQVFEIENKRGVLLPETGGSGITYTLIIGGILSFIASIILIANRRVKYVNFRDEDIF